MNIETIPLNDILLFIYLVEEQSYSSAARKLNMDVSSLSKKIIRLEKNLKTQLVQRTTRQMNLTEAGQTLYQHAINLRQELQDLRHNINHLSMVPTGKLRIKAANSFGHAHLIATIGKFLEIYPEIDCELILDGESTNLIRDKIDVLISIKPLDDIDLIAKKISCRSTGIYASPNYLKKFGTPRTPQNLNQHNCLLHLNRHDKNFWPFMINGEIKLITVSGNFSANTNLALMNAATADFGLAKLPSFIVHDYLQEKKLTPVLMPFWLEPTPIFAIYAKHRDMPKKIKLFVDFLAKTFSNLPCLN